MGTISSGIGLVSGLNIQDLVDKLIDLESGAAKQLQAKIDTNSSIRDAFQSLSLQIVGANLAASKLGKAGAFSQRSASASSDAVTVSAGKGTALGSFQFTPRRLVSTSQLLSSGFATQTSTISTAATTVKIAQGGFVDESTNLSSLNGGAGVRVGNIKITDAAGGSAVVDLTGAVTVADVVNAINGSTGAGVEARAKGDQIEVVDSSGGAGTLSVVDLAGGKAALDLGLTSLTRNGSTYTGQDVYNLGRDLLLDTLRDGNGVRASVGNDFTVTDGSVSFNVDLSDARTLGDVVDLINNNVNNTGGQVLASFNGNRLVLEDTIGSDPVTVTALGGSQAARDLGLTNGSGGSGTLTGDNILGSLDTVLLTTLKGGSATAPTPGTITINGSNVDLSSATTLADVVNGINTAGISGVTASVNAAGNGIEVRRAGAGGLSIADSTGNLATYLNLAGSNPGSDAVVNSGDLDRQYVSENTRLSSLVAGGVPKGKFRITDGNGASAVVDLTQESDDTIGDVIREINTRGLALAARINDTGDGILIEKTGGTQAISVTEVNGGTTAKSLGLLKTPNGAGAVDGSLEVAIDVTATTTLADLVTKLKEAGAPAQAAIIDDGSALNPYRLSLTSNRSGRIGRLLFDAGETSLSLSTVSQAQDAVLVYGGTGAGVTPVQVVSSTNTFSGLVPGVQVTAQTVSNSPVTVTINEDRAAAKEAIQSFIDDYNAIRTYLKDNGGYDSETDERGLLFTNATARQVERQFSNFATGLFSGTGTDIRSLGEIGIKLDRDGQLSLDEEAFDSKMDSDPDAVARFFNATGTGVVARFQSLTDSLTRTGDGALSQQATAIDQRITRLQGNLDSQNARLNAKSLRLFNQFVAMEQALSAFQSQQTALTQLTNLASSFRTTK